MNDRQTVPTTLALVLATSLALAADSMLVFEDDFNGLADGERPSSIVEVRDAPWQRGEAVDKRYAINAGGNAHRLVMPKVRDFQLHFTAEPHRRAKYAPILIIRFREAGGKGYRLHHWFGPTWSRVDLYRWDETVEPPIDLRLQSTSVPKIDLPQVEPIRWRLQVKGDTFRLYRNGKNIWTYTDTDQPLLERGAVAFDVSLYTRGATGPMFLDDVRVESTDKGMAEQFRRVFHFSKQVPGHLVAAHARIFHHVEIHEVFDTGLDELWIDVPEGRMYRVTSSVNFPDMHDGQGRKMAARTPYVRLEKSDGAPFIEQRIYDGVLGSTLPGHRSAAAQLTRLHTEHKELPPDGVHIRTAAVADTSGRQASVAFVASLPPEFHVTAGWEYWLDSDHVHVAGPVEATWNKDGTLFYAGRPIRRGRLAFELRSQASEGILARIGRDNRYYAECVRFQEENHFFLEGEPVRFHLTCGAGLEARLDEPSRWRLLDAYRRPTDKQDSIELEPPHSALWPRADSKKVWHSPPLTVPVAAPGVYWLEVAVGSQTKHYAFSIVPGEQRPGNTAARASGLPRMQGNFYPTQPWPKDIHHYLTGATEARDPDWSRALHAYNLQAIGRRDLQPSQLAWVEGLWDPNAANAGVTIAGHFPDKRLWRLLAADVKSIETFIASSYYTAHPQDGVLRDPEAGADQRWQHLTRHHLKPWCDYWSERTAERDIQIRDALDAIKPGLITSLYGPRLISSYHYGNLYCGKYYGWDWQRRIGRPHLINTWQVETYAREFGRPSMTYTPSLALTEMSLPQVDCQWELYGSVGGVEDSRLAQGRPPHGLSVPTREAVANHATELSLGPWYFDGVFHVAGGTHLAPWVGHFTQPQVFGLVDAMRIFEESKAIRPVRCPIFVRSYAAAERDPSWGEQSVNNSAAEAPAYCYVQARMAGLPGGAMMDIADVSKLDPAHAGLLVLPSLRGATAAQVEAVRAVHRKGVPLLCFDDCGGLEDLFGVRRSDEPIAIEGVRLSIGKLGTVSNAGSSATRSSPEAILAGIPAFARRERVRHRDTIRYELDGATEILVGTNYQAERVALLLTLHAPSDCPPTIFYALGATRVGRREKPLDSTNHEGEVTSDLVRYSLRAAIRAVSRSPVAVAGPASALAFHRSDGSLYVVLLESSFPYPRSGDTEADVLLSIRCSDPRTVTFDCRKPLRDMPSEDERRIVKLGLRPDEVVPLIVRGASDF